jgi:hypothetical protein
MRSRRIITPAIACIAAILAASPAAAPASPLLSGYGGPGQGSQVILGSSLINGPPKGGGGGGGSQGGGGSTGAGESSSAAAAGRLGTATGSGEAPAGIMVHKHVSTTGAHGTKAKGVGVHGSSSGSQANPALPTHAAVRPAAEGSETLGVSGIDLLYVLIALGALALTAVLTRRIARTSDPAGSAGG